ncbi:MAG: FliM/FliN family flagellar motor switch protein [Terriglobales bacterium]
MTDAAAPQPLKPEFQAWFDAWRSHTQDVLSQMSGQPTAFEAVSHPLPPADADLRYTVTAAGAVQGEMSIRLSEASGLRLARKFLGEAEPAAGDESAAQGMGDECREALEELLRQIGGLAATAVGAIVGGQVQLQLTRADAPWTWTPDQLATIRTRDEAGAEIGLELGLNPGLATALTARALAMATEAAAESAVAPPPAPPPGPVPPAAPQILADEPLAEPPVAGYRRLLDVGLGVKLRFGTRRMLLRDVLALSSGLVVELDNELNSAVDLLLDGRVIARGEVVVVDGKYGLRVTDVIDSSPAPRPA